MHEVDDKARLEELQKKIESCQEQAFNDELHRLERETLKSAASLAAQRRSEFEQTIQQKMLSAQEDRKQKGAMIAQIEIQATEELKTIRRNRIEAREREVELKRIEEENRRRAEEEARRRAEAEARRRAEEEARLKAEAEARRKAEEAERRRQEEERKRQEELARKAAAEEAARRLQEEDRRRKEEEQRRKDEEERARTEMETRKRLEEELRQKMDMEKRLRDDVPAQGTFGDTLEEIDTLPIETELERKERERRERIESLMASARKLVLEGDFNSAAIEVAKTLVNDPAHPEALELEAVIRRAQGKERPVEETVVREKKEAPKIEKPTAEPKKRVSRVLIAAIGLVVVAGIAFAYFQLRKTIFPPTASFAILPWTNPERRLEESVLGTALSEEVAGAFERYKTLVPMGFASSYALTQYQADPTRAVFQLGYLYALQGTLARSANGYVIRLRLVDSTGNVRWSQEYDRTPSQLAGLSGSIVNDLHAALNYPTEGLILPPRSVSHPDAYLFYLRGVEMLHRRTGESLANAALLFKQAIDLDDRFAEAQAMAAVIVALQHEHGYVLDDASLQQARELAENAMTIAPTSGKPAIALGMVSIQQRQYDKAMQYLEQAESVEPSNSDAHLYRANVFLRTGVYKNALNELHAAYALNPRDEDILQTFAWTHQFMGTSAEGMWYHETMAFFTKDSTSYLTGPFADAILADPALTLSQFERVAAAFERRLAADPGDYYSMYRLARMQQITGKALDARALLVRAEKTLRDELRLHKDNAHAAMYLALTLTRLGRYPEAATLARRAVELSPKTIELRYNLAQVFSMQMYSQASKSVDQNIKNECVAALRDAITLCYRPEYLCNADFYNMIERGDFYTLIKDAQAN